MEMRRCRVPLEVISSRTFGMSMDGRSGQGGTPVFVVVDPPESWPLRNPEFFLLSVEKNAVSLPFFFVGAAGGG
jgi:hypothetical protein